MRLRGPLDFVARQEHRPARMGLVELVREHPAVDQARQARPGGQPLDATRPLTQDHEGALAGSGRRGVEARLLQGLREQSPALRVRFDQQNARSFGYLVHSPLPENRPGAVTAMPQQADVFRGALRVAMHNPSQAETMLFVYSLTCNDLIHAFHAGLSCAVEAGADACNA